MARDLGRIESKLAALVQERDCRICRTRVETCPECHRPVGGVRGEGEEARARILGEIDRLAAKRASIREQLDAVDGP